MSDPKLTKTKVTIAYTSDDKYSSTYELKAGRGTRHALTGAEVPAERGLLASIEELARLCALFGYEKEARELVEGAFTRVNEYNARRAGAAA